jgi:nitrite reductase (NADH) large subunit
MRHAIATATIDERVVPRPPLPLASGTRALERLVIVGNGMVGHRLCRQLVELGATGQYEIVVFGEEPQPAYDRVHLTEFFSGRDEDDLLLAPARWYADHGIELRLGDPVVQIDRQSRIVTSASGAAIEYSRLVLAIGSVPYIPPIEGAELSRVFVYRTIQDLKAIAAHTRGAASAAVIGGGLLGLEAARALQREGLRLTVIEAAAGLMPARSSISAPARSSSSRLPRSASTCARAPGPDESMRPADGGRCISWGAAV